jgi:SAM-dependent methyltransferase
MRSWFDTFDDELWIHRRDRADEAAFLAKALRLRRGSRVLDAPCGDGAIAIELARRGIDVTGVDFRDVALDRARAAFAAERLASRFIVADLRAMTFDGGGFDAAFNWYGSFGYFPTDDENLRVLRRLAGAVRRGGLVLVDQPNRERMLRGWVGRSETDGVRCDLTWDPRTQRVECAWRLLGRRGFRPQRSSIRMFTPAQLRDLFDAAGLDFVRLWGHWDGSAWSRRSRRSIVVGRRR